MSAIVADTVNSTLIFAGRTITDTPEGDIFTISYANDASSQTQGSNGGVVAKSRADKFAATLTIRVLKYTADDAFLNNLVNSDLSLNQGSLKTNFTRDGISGTETYDIQNGTIQTRGDGTVNNTDGDDIVEYGIFGNMPRSV